ncbi:MAG: ABC transporter permease [Ignavibacteriales bacterium]|nr:MAG: ABC transporter permease [Ignavibacteriales bacterium]
MKIKLKIWQCLFLLWLIILIVRFEQLINIYKLIFSWFILIIDDSKAALAQVNFDLADIFISGLLFILFPLIFFFFKKKLLFLFSRVSFASIVLILLVISFLFAPLITNRNPEFYKNIGMTKLLPPLSAVNVLHFEKENMQPITSLGKFISLRDEVAKKSFNDNIEYVDSTLANGKIIYYQKGIQKEIDNKNVIFENGKPLITSYTFYLGSDQFGRDVLTRLVYGARISLMVGLGSVFISLLIGLILGFLAGYTGGIFNTIFSRITDMFLSFPIIFLVVLILALFGNSLISVISILGFAGWMSLFKIVKTEVLSIKDKNYFISAKLLGLSKKQLLTREVLPVIIVPIVVNLIFQFGNVIIAESALSYLGLGLGENYPSWGSMIQSGQEYLSSAWWMIFFPGMILILTLLSANSFGLSLNRKLNPRLQND